MGLLVTALIEEKYFSTNQDSSPQDLYTITLTLLSTKPQIANWTPIQSVAKSNFDWLFPSYMDVHPDNYCGFWAILHSIFIAQEQHCSLCYTEVHSVLAKGQIINILFFSVVIRSKWINRWICRRIWARNLNQSTKQKDRKRNQKSLE